MSIATFQKKVFNVSRNNKYIMDGLAWSSTLNTESQEKLKSKPSTYIKGEALMPLSFTIPLRVELGHDVRKEIESWEAILSKQSPDLFILGSKQIGKNKWLLKSVSVSDTEIDGKGNLRKATLSLSLEEYVRAGKAEAKKTTAATTSTGTTIPPNQYIIDPPNKAEEKRLNINAEIAKARGKVSNLM
jgi:hypothetical protein